MQEAAFRKSAAQVVEGVADHPASLVKDWPSLFVNSLWGHMFMGLGMMGGGGAAGDKRLKTGALCEEEGRERRGGAVTVHAVMG